MPPALITPGAQISTVTPLAAKAGQEATTAIATATATATEAEAQATVATLTAAPAGAEAGADLTWLTKQQWCSSSKTATTTAKQQQGQLQKYQMQL